MTEEKSNPKLRIEVVSARKGQMTDAMRKGEEAASIGLACLEVEPGIEVKRKSELM